MTEEETLDPATLKNIRLVKRTVLAIWLATVIAFAVLAYYAPSLSQQGGAFYLRQV